MSSGQSSDEHRQAQQKTIDPLEGQLQAEEPMIAEIKRLRERLVTLEAENATLNMKLSQQQWEVEHRLAEIEMQICGASSADSSAEDNERNKESII
ncbi:unnamed protein product [Nezara viridula]|uniref:Uncharacterized protein n=1 Tax=Nezara viridula TaxID=85310 RepID=A0A9P0MLJ4_NEZVI|nr:unnamed protein product [Nezara viridula]